MLPLNLTNKPQVGVVDDDDSMRHFLNAFLTEHGYQAVIIGGAEEAIRRYRDDRPAAVILDMVLTGEMDGLAALAALKCASACTFATTAARGCHRWCASRRCAALATRASRSLP